MIRSPAKAVDICIREGETASHPQGPRGPSLILADTGIATRPGITQSTSRIKIKLTTSAHLREACLPVTALPLLYTRIPRSRQVPAL